MGVWWRRCWWRWRLRRADRRWRRALDDAIRGVVSPEWSVQVWHDYLRVREHAGRVAAGVDGRHCRGRA